MYKKRAYISLQALRINLRFASGYLKYQIDRHVGDSNTLSKILDLAILKSLE